MGATHGRVYAVVFCKEQNGTKCKNFAVLLFLGQYIHSFVLPKISGRGAIPPSHPPKSATAKYHKENHAYTYSVVTI